MDLAGSILGLALTLPLYPIIAAAIYLESPGSIFFRQKRAGELLGLEPGSRHRFRFREFEIIKFRSMREDAEAESGAVIARHGDGRETRVGRILRATRLDELPQFFNILRGDMSLVGPRPERPELIAQFVLAIPMFEERMRGVKPGLTGRAQVTLSYSGGALPGSPVERFLDTLTNPFKVEGAEGALADDMRIKAMFDFAYGAAVEDFFSFLREDLTILALTPLAILRRTGRGR